MVKLNRKYHLRRKGVGKGKVRRNPNVIRITENKFRNVWVGATKNKTNEGYKISVLSIGESDRFFRAKNKADIKKVINKKVKNLYAWKYGGSR